MSLDFKKHLERKIVPLDRLLERIKELRREGKTIVTLNGSFDLLHSGHLYILYEAKKCGDILIVALNSDQSVRAYKNPLRPIIPLEERMKMLSSVEFVDYLTWFDETDPRALLEKIQPDVHVNGAEYGAHCIESEVVLRHGGRLHLVERIDGLSTSKVIEKIKCV